MINPVELRKALMFDVSYITLRILAEMYAKNPKDVTDMLNELIPTDEKIKPLQDRAMFFAYQADKQLTLSQKFFGTQGINSLIKRSAEQFDRYKKLMEEVLKKH